jgi:cyclopropane fatty-acyl-phospholipid synthase-like methyltransferase
LVLSCSGFLGNKRLNPWDSFWKKRSMYRGASWAKKRIIAVISDYIKPGAKVLDMGSGSGFFSAYFISRGCEVSSLDYSEEALSLTKENTRNKSERYVEADILDESELFKIYGGFDVIFTDGLLEHYSEKEQDRIINNMKRLKKKDGYLMNFAPNGFSLWSLVRPFLMSIKETPFTFNGFTGLHVRNGLKIVASGGINVVPLKYSPEKLLGKYAGMLFYCIAV